MDFQNRTVIVTGGTGALGRAVVGALLAAGAQCRLSYLHEKEVATFPYKDRVTLVGPCELTNEADVAQLYEGVDGLWASIHIAGGFAMSKLEETGKNDLMEMVNTNLVSCHLCSRAAVRAFSNGGRIVNVGARPGLEPRLGAGMSAYAASKAAVIALTQALAAELAPRDILVNAVVPSIIDTPANRASMPDADHAAWPRPDQIAATIAFLASPDNRVTTGGAIPVSGRT
ncbi:MAG: SDR family oxidoreductase [Ferrovibrio sp.]|uniref:SDR family oxidoreductase n=1 Tax=Ferrovibrio sp. TaxID=1917215 RepID=UPI00262DD323|nr:SDR family oxidoreductase [Ferrovibrio sp.]MCW0232445.1 SDR family oxidoreductase [Ferrovibrio sp.]